MLSRGDGPATRFTLRCNTVSVITIRFFHKLQFMKILRAVTINFIEHKKRLSYFNAKMYLILAEIYWLDL